MISKLNASVHATNANLDNSHRPKSVQKSESTDRISEIKAQIKNGEYKINLQQTAQKMAEYLG